MELYVVVEQWEESWEFNRVFKSVLGVFENLRLLNQFLLSRYDEEINMENESEHTFSYGDSIITVVKTTLNSYEETIY